MAIRIEMNYYAVAKKQTNIKKCTKEIIYDKQHIFPAKIAIHFITMSKTSKI